MRIGCIYPFIYPFLPISSCCYNNLFVAIDFLDSWAGFRFRGAWTEQNSGGTPIKNSPEVNERWATNPQYLLELDKDMDLFISLGQPDGRLIPGETYPFPDTIHHVMFCMFRLEDGESVPMAAFDRKRPKFDGKPQPWMSTIKEYRELSEYWKNVKAGRYIIVPRYDHKSIKLTYILVARGPRRLASFT